MQLKTIITLILTDEPIAELDCNGLQGQKAHV